MPSAMSLTPLSRNIDQDSLSPFLWEVTSSSNQHCGLMSAYRLVIEEIEDGKLISSYTRWVDAVHTNGTDNPGVYLTFSSRFKRIWLEAKQRLLESAARKPPHIGLRSRYAIRLYAWAQEHRSAGSKRITLERLRTVLGLDSVKDPKGRVIRKAPLPVWADLRQRALDLAIAQINQKTDLNITLESLERSAHRRVTALTFSIKARTIQNQPSGQTQKTMNGRLR